MKQLNQYINEKLVLSKTYKKIKPKSLIELREIINNTELNDGCLDLRHIDVSEFNSLKELIIDREDIKEIDVTGWDVKSVNNLDSFIDNCVNLESVYGLETWEIKKVTSINCLFMHCKKLTHIDLTGWYLGNVENCQFAFTDCPELKIDLRDTGLNVEGCNIKVFFGRNSHGVKYQ